MVKLIKIKNLKKIMSCLTALSARPPLPCPYGHNIMGYSQTCLKGSAQGTGKNWLLKTGDPLIQVHFHYNLVQRIPKKWLLKACDPLIQRPLKIGSTVPLSQDFSWVGTLLAHTAKRQVGQGNHGSPSKSFLRQHDCSKLYKMA